MDVFAGMRFMWERFMRGMRERGLRGGLLERSPPHPPRTFIALGNKVIYYPCAHPFNSSRGRFGTTTQNGFLFCFAHGKGATNQQLNCFEAETKKG
jgi:hypothetical protein